MKKIETIIITFFLWIFILFMIYPVLNIISVSLRTDNAFQVKSLSLFEKAESYIDENKNGKYDIGEQYDDTNFSFIGIILNYFELFRILLNYFEFISNYFRIVFNYFQLF